MEERRWGHALPLFAAVAAVAGIGMVSHYRASAAQLELTAMTTMLGFEAHNSYTEMTQKPIGDGYVWLSRYKLAEPHREATFVATGKLASVDEVFSWSVDGRELEGETAAHTFNTTGEFTVVLRAYADSSSSTSRVSTDSVFVKYVRREIRALTDSDRESYFSALEVIYKMPCDDGKKAYGKSFECIDTFVSMHNDFAGDPYCDHAHDGYGFLTTHVGLSMWFEQALQAVNPVVSLPYWDYTIEMHSVYTAGGDISKWRQSVVWSDTWFGSASPPSRVVTDGRFGYTPVTSNSSLSEFSNSYGMMRAPWNNNNNAYVTRSNTSYGFSITDMPGCASHYNVLQYANFSDFGYHIMYNPHGTTHLAIGGVWNADWHQKLLDVDYNMVIAPSWTLLGFAKQKNMFRAGYSSCPSSCSADTPMSECKCECKGVDKKISDGRYNEILDKIMQGYEPYLQDKSGNNIGDYIYKLLCNSFDDTYAVMGDSLESASPSDVSFWPTHPTVERLFTWRRILGMDMYWPRDWAWSVEGTRIAYCMGHNEDDVLPFLGLFESSEGPYSNREMLHLIDPAHSYSPYIYDNFEWPHCVDEGYSIDLLTMTGPPDSNIKRA